MCSQLFLLISLANICCSWDLDVCSTEGLLRGLPGTGSVPVCRRRAVAAAVAVWAGLLSAERLLWMKPPSA